MWEQFLDGTWVEKAANAFLVVITAFGIIISWIVGKPKTASNEVPQRVEVAGALVDATQARDIVRAVDNNTEAVRSNTDKLARTDNALDQLHQAVDDLRLEMRMAKR